MPELVGNIFRENIHRNIEEVIKVDDLDDAVLIGEIKEYHPTASIQDQMVEVLKAYDGLRQGPTEDVGVWVSGFFGAGKSSFAKLLGILLESRTIGSQDAVDLFSNRITNNEIKVLLRQIREHIPTHVVIFDILKDNIAGAREHPVTMVMYKALLRSLGYATELDLAELEINLEQRGELEAFSDKYAALYPGRTWDEAKRLTMTAINEASRVRHELDDKTYNAPDSWARSRARTEISPRKLAERVLQLSKARASGRNVVFVVDEIGQYTARDLTRIGDLQGVIESFSLVGKGKIWLIATSQEKLEAIVDIWEKAKSDLVRLKDRFAFPVDIKSTDIREVASHRVLAKSAEAEKALRALYEAHSGKLKTSTAVTAAVQLPTLDEDAFVRLYPLLPYQVDLLIDVVSGLRRQGTGSQTMGGANRTIIKLAQQLLIHEKVGLAAKPLGALVTFDSVYDLISTNIASEAQQEIEEIAQGVGDFEGRVAKALVLLQFAERAHATEDNLAAVLHPTVDAQSVLPQVRKAVEKLIAARKVRRTEHGLKIQSAAERTWDEERDARQPTPGDRSRIVKEVIEQLWGKGKTQQPSVQLGRTGRFTGGLRTGSESLVDGDVTFEVRLLDPGRPIDWQVEEARKLTQDKEQERLVMWTAELSGEAEDAIRERFRSDRMIQRGPRTTDEEALLRDEARRKRGADAKLRKEVERALCRGRIFFRGNDRSPNDEATDPKAEARRVLGQALEQIFHRFGDGDVKVGRRTSRPSSRTRAWRACLTATAISRSCKPSTARPAWSPTRAPPRTSSTGFACAATVARSRADARPSSTSRPPPTAGGSSWCSSWWPRCCVKARSTLPWAGNSSSTPSPPRRRKRSPTTPPSALSRCACASPPLSRRNSVRPVRRSSRASASAARRSLSSPLPAACASTWVVRSRFSSRSATFCAISTCPATEPSSRASTPCAPSRAATTRTPSSPSLRAPTP